MKHICRCQDVTVSWRPVHTSVKCSGHFILINVRVSIQTTVSRELILMSVRLGKILLSTPHQIFPHPLFLFTLYFIIIITIFTFILSKVAYIRQRPNYLFRFHICIKKVITHNNLPTYTNIKVRESVIVKAT